MEDIVAPTFGVGHSTNWANYAQMCHGGWRLGCYYCKRRDDVRLPPSAWPLHPNAGLWYLRHKKLKHCPHTPHRERPFSDLPSTGNDITVAQGSANNQSWLTCFLSLVMCRLQADFGTY
ncbi:uncharacterized protein LOC144053970 isoform X2 [Vanacampus margaritifer]